MAEVVNFTETQIAEPAMTESSIMEVAIAAPTVTEGRRVLIIEGIRENGSKFRPSDWPERISCTFAGFGRDQRLRYSPGVRPKVLNGQRVLVVEPALLEHNPEMFHSVMKFARDNNLRTREEVDSQD